MEYFIIAAVVVAWLWIGGRGLRDWGRYPSARHVRGFADAYSVPLTSTTEPLISAQLTRVRRWRIGGVIVTVILVGIATGSTINLLAIVGGLALGSLAAEVLYRPTHTTRRAASLATRKTTDHVQPLLIWFPIVASVVLGAVTALTAATWSGLEQSAGPPSRSWFVGMGAFGVCGGLLSLVVASRISRRPEPRDDLAAAAVGYALRTSSVMSVIGGGLVLVGVGMYQVANQAVLLDGDHSPVHQWVDNLTLLGAAVAIAGGAGLVLGALPGSRATATQQSGAVT